MADEITEYKPAPPIIPKKERRKLASILEKAGKRTFFSAPLGKRVTYEEAIAEMLYDLLVFGTAVFADGSGTVEITDSKDWMEVIKFLHNHIDGPVTVNQNAGVILNQFKVYAGIDTNEV